MYAFEASSCFLETLNCNSFWKTQLFLEDIRKSKSEIVFLCLKSNFSSVLLSLTKSEPYFSLKTPFNESEAGNLICAINKNTKVLMCGAVDPNAIINTTKPVIF